ncbi:MAG: hypothetical protein OEP95_07850, partial [Myxococcales bacterium]|nr:hypothetical protein [Myxococcales bacterium]
VSREHADRIADRLRIPLPEASIARLAREGANGGWAIFEETVRTLRAEGLADGLAIMTPQMDPPPEDGARICHALSR